MTVEHSDPDLYEVGNHVLMHNVSSSSLREWDIAMATFNLAFTVWGFVGNCFALGYFLGKTELVSRLYQHINIIDIIICLAQIPVIQVLLTDRNPGMFNSPVFCAAWAVIYRSITKLYVMAVLLLSFSRTIAICYPFYQIRKGAVIAALYIYLLYLALRQAFKLLTGFKVIYSNDITYCYPYLLPDNTTNKLSDYQSKLMTAEYIIVTLETGLPLVLIILNFVVIVMKLVCSKKVSTSTAGQQRKAAITVAIFTGVFLGCYLPLSIFFALYAITSSTAKNDFNPSSGIFSDFTTFWYVWPLCECLLNSLNAGLDIAIFLARVKHFRDFLWQMVPYKKSVVREGVSGFNLTGTGTCISATT